MPLLPLPLVERLLATAMSRGAEFGEVYVERATTTAVSGGYADQTREILVANTPRGGLHPQRDFALRRQAGGEGAAAELPARALAAHDQHELVVSGK